MFGYTVLQYNTPDTYDDIFRNWLKSVSNGLEFLRMKNDIQYLTKCQNLSEQRDTLTGMYNGSGIEKAYKSAVVHDNYELYFVVLKVFLFDESFSDMDNDKKIEAVLDAAKAVGKFCRNHDICGRINENTFVCIVQSNAGADILTDALSAILVQHKKYMKCCGMDSFACAAEKCDGTPYSVMLERCSAELDKKIKEISGKRLVRHYREMIEMRNYVYIHPDETFDTEALHERFSGSSGYLRMVFKQCFDTSFHKDCIAARITKAKYYLATTNFSMIEIAEKCGYDDKKYFLRQFSSSAGLTPVQYRNLIQG